MQNSKSHLALRALVEGAIFVAVAYVLGLIKIYHLPQGGSISLLMLPILFYAVRWGVGHGMVAGCALGIIDFMLGGGIAIGWQSILGDYVIACTLLGLAGLFRKKNWSLFAGIIAGSLGRFLSIWVTGATLWGEYMPENFLGLDMTNEWFYSFLYNGVPIFLSMALCLVVGGVLYAIPRLRVYLLGQDISK
ncbi:MAG: energy-coupled thiamine transporter ThiT [Oscillospiraceae bacterium]